jgi:heat-inducible transcriptional repressor
MEPVNFTEREAQILKTVVEEYIATAEPVGSETLDKKFNLGVSPATIRNEMVKLTSKGYLKQPHTSSGRVPTPKALKYYVHNFLRQKDLSVTEEVSVKEKVWNFRYQLDRLLKEAVLTLAQRTKALSVAATDEGDFYYAGASNLLDFPEFYDLALAKELFSLLDQYEYWKQLFSRSTESDLTILVGEELGEHFAPCGLVFTKFNIPGHGIGRIGVIGSNRLDYAYVIPVVRYLGHLLSEIAV